LRLAPCALNLGAWRWSYTSLFTPHALKDRLHLPAIIAPLPGTVDDQCAADPSGRAGILCALPPAPASPPLLPRVAQAQTLGLQAVGAPFPRAGSRQALLGQMDHAAAPARPEHQAGLTAEIAQSAASSWPRRRRSPPRPPGRSPARSRTGLASTTSKPPPGPPAGRRRSARAMRHPLPDRDTHTAAAARQLRLQLDANELPPLPLLGRSSGITHCRCRDRHRALAGMVAKAPEQQRIE